MNNSFQPAGEEFQISKSSTYAQTLSDVAMDANDDFVVVWEGDDQSSEWGVYGDYFYNAGPNAGQATGPMLLNNTPNSRGSFSLGDSIDLKDDGPRVAMDSPKGQSNGGFVVTWADFLNTYNAYEIFAQQFAPGGVPLANEFMVNQTTTYGMWKLMPAVGVDPAGNFTIVWTSYGQDDAEVGKPGTLDYGIYARMYNADGTPFANEPDEFRVNATTLGNQVAPAVSRDDPNDDAIIAWVGPDPTNAANTAIYDRNVDPPALTTAPITPSISVSGETVSVGHSATQLTFTVTLSAATSNPVTVHYGTANGTATAGGQLRRFRHVGLFARADDRDRHGERRRLGRRRIGQPDILPESDEADRRHHRAGLGHGDDQRLLAHAVDYSDDLRRQRSGPSRQLGHPGRLHCEPFGRLVQHGHDDLRHGGWHGHVRQRRATRLPMARLTFSPGQTSETVAVPVSGMAAPGLSNQTFILNLANPVNGKIVQCAGHGHACQRCDDDDGLSDDFHRQPNRASRQFGHAGRLHREPVGCHDQHGHDDLRHGRRHGHRCQRGLHAHLWHADFQPGQTSKTISVPVAALKAGGSANQTFVLSLADSINGKIVGSPATATLVNAATAPAGSAISVGNVSVQVGSAATQANFTVTLSASSTKPVTVTYGTANGTATSASGAYTPTTGTLVFSPGQTSKTVAVPVSGLKTAGLPNQTFMLNLTNSVNATIIASPATATLVDAVPGTAASDDIRGWRDRPGRKHGHPGRLHREPVGRHNQDGHGDLRYVGRHGHRCQRRLHAHLGHAGLQPRPDLEDRFGSRCRHEYRQPVERDAPLCRGRRV